MEVWTFTVAEFAFLAQTATALGHAADINASTVSGKRAMVWIVKVGGLIPNAGEESIQGYLL